MISLIKRTANKQAKNESEQNNLRWKKKGNKNPGQRWIKVNQVFFSMYIMTSWHSVRTIFYVNGCTIWSISIRGSGQVKTLKNVSHVIAPTPSRLSTSLITCRHRLQAPFFRYLFSYLSVITFLEWRSSPKINRRKSAQAQATKITWGGENAKGRDPSIEGRKCPTLRAKLRFLVVCQHDSASEFGCLIFFAAFRISSTH